MRGGAIDRDGDRSLSCRSPPRSCVCKVDTRQPDVGCFSPPGTQAIAMVVFVRRSAGVNYSLSARAVDSLAIDHLDGTRHAVVWHELTSAGDFDVRAAFYEGRSTAGGVTVVPTFCGTRLDIVATSPPAVGHPFAVDLVGFSGAAVLLVGAPTTPQPLCFAVPNPCALGVSPIVLNILGTRFAAVVPCESGLVNAPLAFQSVDVGVTAGCSFAGVPLRTTDTLVVRFQ